MDTLETIVALFTAVGSIAAVVVAILAFRTYRDLSPTSQLLRRQREYMLDVASVTRQVLELIEAFEEIHHESGKPKSNYLFHSLNQLSGQLNELVHGANAIGMVNAIVGSHDNRWRLLTAFRSTLRDYETLDPKTMTVQETRRLHYFYGIIRLAHSCMDYDIDAPYGRQKNRQPSSIVDEYKTLQNDIDKSLQTTFNDDFRKDAWTYL